MYCRSFELCGCVLYCRRFGNTYLIAFGVKGYLNCLCGYYDHTWVEVLRFGSAHSGILLPILELFGTFWSWAGQREALEGNVCRSVSPE